jgi:hypothetical protein
MTLYRDENGNLESDDFIPRLATDEDLLERYRKAFQQTRSSQSRTMLNEDIAKMLLLCSIELGKRGYTEGDVGQWMSPPNKE